MKTLFWAWIGTNFFVFLLSLGTAPVFAIMAMVYVLSEPLYGFWPQFWASAIVLQHVAAVAAIIWDDVFNRART